MSDLQNWIIAKPKSNSNCTEWFVKNKAANAPITFEEIVMVMIKVLGERLYKVYLTTMPIPRLLPFLFDLLFLIWTTNIDKQLT